MIVTLGYIKTFLLISPTVFITYFGKRLIMAAPPSILFIFNSLAKFSQLAFFSFSKWLKNLWFSRSQMPRILFFIFNLQIPLFGSRKGSQKSAGECLNIFYIHILFIAKFGSTVFMD
jgi:hypothetical protein